MAREGGTHEHNQGNNCLVQRFKMKIIDHTDDMPF